MLLQPPATFCTSVQPIAAARQEWVLRSRRCMLCQIQRICVASSIKRVALHGADRCMQMHSSPIDVSVDAFDAKQKLRKITKGELRKLSDQQMQLESQLITEHVLALDVFQKSSRIGIYVHAARLREVDTTSLISAALGAGKRCHVPLVMDDNSHMRLLHLDSRDGLQAAPPFGILEPTETYADGSAREDALEMSEGLDLLVMPGLAFDRDGNRLGRGGGYYDLFVSRCFARALELRQPPPKLVALAYQAQMVESVPMTPHDRRVDVLITSTGIVQP